MRPQSLGRPDRLFNRAAWHWAVSKRERPALGRFAARCLRNAGGSAVAPTKLDIPFPSDATARTRVKRSPLFYLSGVTVAVLLVLAADLRYAAAPSESFGLAGILWIAGIALLLCSAFFGSHSLWGVSSAPRLPRWPTWETALLAVLFVLALLSRVWNLRNFPDNIYPDEIMTGTVATQSYLSPTTPPSVFSTLWSGIDLPALLVLVRGRMIL